MLPVLSAVVEGSNIFSSSSKLKSCKPISSKIPSCGSESLGDVLLMFDIDGDVEGTLDGDVHGPNKEEEGNGDGCSCIIFLFLD